MLYNPRETHSAKALQTLKLMGTEPDDWHLTPIKWVKETREVRGWVTCPDCHGTRWVLKDENGNLIPKPELVDLPAPPHGASDDVWRARFEEMDRRREVVNDWSRRARAQSPRADYGNCQRCIRKQRGYYLPSGQVPGLVMAEVDVGYPQWPKGTEFTSRFGGQGNCDLCNKVIMQSGRVPVNTDGPKPLGMWVGEDCAKKFLDVKIKRKADSIMEDGNVTKGSKKNPGKLCSGCDATVPDNTDYCDRCWNKVTAKKPWRKCAGCGKQTKAIVCKDCANAPPSNKPRCVQCGAHATPGSSYCWFCQPKKNPGSLEPHDLKRAISKWEEFHDLDHETVGKFRVSSMPKTVTVVGDMTWVLYASTKWTGKRENYIHDHEAGVKCGRTDSDAEGKTVKVPKWIQETKTLVFLGDCLGFAYEDDEGEEIEAATKRPYPGLYCTPDGKCLVVVENKSRVAAVIWGGWLDVEDRGIVN